MRCPPIRPSKTHSVIVSGAMQERWMSMLKAVTPDHDITDEVCVWPTGTRIDVLDAGTDDSLVIYEMKVKKRANRSTCISC